jgi:Mn2+/Fe2+ NRAMP family transporter
MLLGEAIGSGEILTEPVAGARYGGALLWVILFTVVTKAFWNEAIGRVAIATGQNFLEACTGMGPPTSWIPWLWLAINALKDFLLRGGIVAIGGLICYDVFGDLPGWMVPGFAAPGTPANVAAQSVTWTFLNFGLVWVILVAGGYRVAESFNTVFCLVFTVGLVACAVFIFPRVTGELASGLVPRMATSPDQLLIMMSLAGIVMAGSGTIKYSAWAEERDMGLFAHTREAGRMTRAQFQPTSEEEVQRMQGWLRVNRINISLSYTLGALICLATFVLGVGILKPAGIQLGGPGLARDLSLMMTEVLGPWARSLFYLGAWAAIMSTAISIFDGSSRLFLQPLRAKLPRIFARLGANTWQKIIMSLMMAGSWIVFAFIPKPVTLVLVMGAVDAPLIGVLMITYAFLGRRYLPEQYRSGVFWFAGMVLMGTLYLALGVSYAFLKN